jgi:hypothetical protein
MINEETLVLLEKAWAKQGECHSCGWWPAFYEIADDLWEDSPGIFTAPCISKDDNDSWDHRGHRICLNG